MIRALIADDHAIFRSGLARIIETTADIAVEAVAGNADELLRVLPTCDVDILLLDLSMPGARGVDLIKAAREVKPGLPILVLTMHNEGRTATWALEAGAAGYATKDSDPEDLIDGIRRVAQGRRYLSPDIAEAVGHLSLNRRGTEGESLSPREWEILGMLARGLEINAVARELHISPKTVSTHKMRLMKKLSLTNNVDLVHYTIRRGLAPEPSPSLPQPALAR